MMTLDDLGEGGLPYLVRPDDVISGQPLMTVDDRGEGGSQPNVMSFLDE